MTATSWIFEGLKPKKRAKKKNKAKKEAEIDQIEEPVRLNFDTQRIFANSRPEPISQIMLNASETQALSFQATVRLPIKEANRNGNELVIFSPQTMLCNFARQLFAQLENGETLLNNVGKDFQNSASMIRHLLHGLNHWIVYCFFGMIKKEGYQDSSQIRSRLYARRSRRLGGFPVAERFEFEHF